jgi:ribosomal protein S18 acetylase RimI-like enzyme
MSVIYREARREDSSELAELVSIASGGVIDFLFKDLVPGLSPVEVVAQGFAGDNYPHTFKNAILAEYRQEVIGMSLSYPSHLHTVTDEMRSFLPADRLAHLKDFYDARVERSWYLDTLGIKENYRRQGIGRKLIELTVEKAVRHKFRTISLIVFADNMPALSLYQRVGFQTVRKVRLSANEYILHEGDSLLVKYDIPPDN